jgi:hypothetical protein
MPDLGPDSLPRAGTPASANVRRVAVAILVFGLVMRLAPVFVMDAGWPTPWPESRPYYDIGQSVADGQGFQRPAAVGSGAFLADRMPGYPLMVAAASWTGWDMRALVLAQALAGTVVLILVLAMSTRLGGGWAGVVAAALVVFDPLQVVYCAAILPQIIMSLALVVTVAAGLVFLRACDRVALATCLPAGSPGSTGGQAASGTPVSGTPVAGTSRLPFTAWLWAAAAGATMAAAVYMDWTALGVAVVAGAAALVAAISKRSRRRYLKGWALGATVMVAALVPWVIRNEAALGRPVLATDFGLRLISGFWPDSNEPGDALLRQQLGDDDYLRGEVLLNDHCYAIARERILRHPGLWLEQTAGHAVEMWSPATLVGIEWNLPKAAGYTSLIPVAVLALAGVWVLRRRPAVLVWLLAVPVGLTLAYAPFEAMPKDRISVMPILAVLGGVGLGAILGTRGAKSHA